MGQNIDILHEFLYMLCRFHFVFEIFFDLFSALSFSSYFMARHFSPDLFRYIYIANTRPPEAFSPRYTYAACTLTLDD
jgi:hypothetical protein